MKIRAYQVAPEHQESPVLHYDVFPDDIIVSGNREYIDHTIPAFDHIKRYFDEMAGAWEDANFYYQYNGNGKYTKVKKKPDCTIAELLMDYGFVREDGKRWDNYQKHEWRLMLEGTAGADEDETILACLRLITGKNWNCRQITGCCQSDWNYIYYRQDEWTEKALEYFEIEYFNTGDEWRIEDEEGDDMGRIYTHEWNDDEKKREIAENIGVDPDEVTLYLFDGWTKTAKYMEV